jgi:hypothetical protein
MASHVSVEAAPTGPVNAGTSRGEVVDRMLSLLETTPAGRAR